MSISGPGDPYLTPDPSVIAESVVETIRYLHSSYPKWTSALNDILHERLESAKLSRRAGDEVSLVQLWPALLVIAGADPGLRVGAKCKNAKGELGLVLGVTNRAHGSIRVSWDSGEEVQEVPASLVRPANYIAFDLDQFDVINSDTIRALARLVDLDSMTNKSTLTTPRGTPRNSTRTTPKPSMINTELRSISPPPVNSLLPSLSVQSGNIEDKSDRHLSRKFAAQMIQNVGLRTIMMIFSTCKIADISENAAKKSLLAELISHSSKPSSLEVGVPLGDLIRTSNVMLSLAIGAASPWECPTTTGAFSDDSLVSSEDDDEDDPMSDDEDDEDYLTDAERDDSSMPPVLQALINQVNEATAALNQPGNHHTGISEIERVLGNVTQQRANSTGNTSTSGTGPSPRRVSRNTAGGNRTTRSNTSSNPPPSAPPPSAPIGPAPPAPPPPPVTALVEMGFTLEHIQAGIRAQNFNASALTATQIAMLASWLIENPAPPPTTTTREETDAEEPDHESSMVDFEDLMMDDNPRPLFDSEDDNDQVVSNQVSSESLTRTLAEFDTALAEVSVLIVNFVLLY